MIYVTKPFLPHRKTLEKYIDIIYKSNYLTNFGPLERELTEKLKEYLNINNLLLVNNGTLALQVLYKALNLSGNVITTPFSFIATTSSLVWEGLEPNFVDINSSSLNIDPDLIEKSVDKQTSAVLATHVFGRGCDVNRIQNVANNNALKVIYDAAHAFGVYTKDEERNILTYGNASILSFHATKLFHTIEGGAIVSNDVELIKECKKIINFGITDYDKISGVGINAKMNEFSAAMGLAVLEHIDEISESRQIICEYYKNNLNPKLLLQNLDHTNDNFSYMPILLDNRDQMLNVHKSLQDNNIFARRYFSPSLNTVDYIKNKKSCPISEDISSRILCLPLYHDLEQNSQKNIISIINQKVK